MTTIASQFAEQLLSVQCIKVQPTQPFTWASGWLSPFYCDNRKTLAYPQVRTFVKEQLAVVEDLISTGGSSLKAVEALRAAGFEILGMVASFTYGFPVAAEAFAAAGVTLTTLTNYEAVVETACRVGYIDESQLPLLARWRANPSTWTPEA